MTTLTVHNTPWVAEWVEALAKNPPKTTGMLTRVDEDGEPIGDCCIGVLCRLQNVPYRLDWLSLGSARQYHEKDLREASTQMPPGSVTQRLLGERYGSYELVGLSYYTEQADSERYGYAVYCTDHLPTINDSYGLTHAQHADLIRYFGIRWEG